MDGNIIAILVGIGLFLAGVVTKGKLAKRADIKEDVNQARDVEAKGASDAKQRHDDKVQAAIEEAKREVDSRPVTGDPVADLADRIRRHRDRRSRR